MTANTVMAAIVLLPLGGALAAFAWPRIGRWVGVTVLAMLVMGGGWLANAVMRTGPLTQSVGGWGAPLGIDLAADGLSVFLLLVVSVVGLPVSLHAHGYFGPVRPGEAGIKARYFWPIWMFLVAALNAMLMSRDVFNLYVTLELQGLAAVALVGLAAERAALGAALRYLFVGLGGSLLFLMGVALLYGGYGTVDMTGLRDRVESEPFAAIALVLMTGGLMMKAALFPLHFWLPPAHGSAPAPVSAVLSALVVKGSLYILWRLWFEVFGGVVNPGAVQWMGFLGAAAILWGSAQALVQERLKLLIAYSTVAQVGYLFLVFPLALAAESGPMAGLGALTFLGAHATAKAAMFLAVGNVLRAAGHDRIRELAGLAGVLPVSAFAMGLAGMTLIGLPPSAGFVGKWYLLTAGLAQGQWWWVVVIVGGSLLAAGYIMRVLLPAFTPARETAAVKPVTPGMEWSAFALALLSVGLGFGGSFSVRLWGDGWAGGGGE